MATGISTKGARFRSSRIVLSVLVHITLLCIFLCKTPPRIAPMLFPGDSHGTQLTLTYLPGRVPQAPTFKFDAATKPVESAEAKLANPKLALPHPVVQPQATLERPQKPAALPDTSNSPSSPNPNSATGADSLGTGNINIAYLDAFRSPRPDLSSLPRGVSGDVILDVTIDTFGKVVALKKLSGVGYGIDESVIATVQAWVFHPATRDGTPVVSEQELHFHYERGHNG